MKKNNDEEMLIDILLNLFILKDIENKFYEIFDSKMDLVDLFIFLPMKTVKQIEKDLNKEFYLEGDEKDDSSR